MSASEQTVVVVGLGYVGLPLAVALAKNYKVVGFDISEARIAELRQGHDRTREVASECLGAAALYLTAKAEEVPPSDFYIVTVPTPIDSAKKPDLTIIKQATQTVGRLLQRAHEAGHRPVVVYESTVYPGVTEEICAPILEEFSGLTWGEDFFLGYSPERINPGDREHSIDKITKVVAGDNSQTLARISALYQKVTTGGVFEARNIRTAEAAKVIENAQRDINIAFMNEISLIFARMELSIWDVLAAARTKWNFLPFAPGLVGGHCIGVDPYYLSYRAEQLGFDPRVILAGRGVNDHMAQAVADRLHALSGSVSKRILVLGLTFKEDVPDLRNSKVVDLVIALQRYGHQVTVHDPLADKEEALSEYGLAIQPDALDKTYDLVLLAVPHKEYLAFGVSMLRRAVAPQGKLADLKGVLGSGADWTL